MTDSFEEYREVPGKCVDCGNSPVNHFGTYLSQTLSVFVGGLARKVRSPYLIKGMDAIFARLEPLVYVSTTFIPGIRFGNDPRGAITYRSQVVWEEAQKRGIEMQQLRFFGRGTELYRARIHGRWFYFQSLPMPHGTDSISDVTDDKDALSHTLRALGIPAPRSVSVTSLKGALKEFPSFEGPIVVKPRSGSRARHTTVNVKNETELRVAFARAQQLCRYVVMETYLEGSVCRGTVVGGKLAGFLQGFPPRVIGDGISSVRILLERANASKPARVQDIVITAKHEAFLESFGYSLDSVLPASKEVALTHHTGRLFGGRTRELVNTVHPKLRNYIERASGVTTIPVVGFDLIIQDPEKDPDEQTWGIIEGNGLPYIDLHYLPLEGKPSRVAENVWEYVAAHPELYS